MCAQALVGLAVHARFDGVEHTVGARACTRACPLIHPIPYPTHTDTPHSPPSPSTQT